MQNSSDGDPYPEALAYEDTAFKAAKRALASIAARSGACARGRVARAPSSAGMEAGVGEPLCVLCDVHC